MNIKSLLVMLLVTGAGLHNKGLAAERPNFVIIFIDDMGYGDIGPFGSEINDTPNLDRMAKEGMTLTSFYAAPVCSASRAQLLTGCYAPRVSVPGVFFPAGPKGLNPEETTVAEYLKSLGYATTCIGKWHLGDQPEFLPTNQGFDHYFGIPYSNDMQRTSSADGRRVTPLLRDDKVAELLEDEGQRRVTREYTEEAVKFLEDRSDERFFLYLPHTAMHIPLFPHESFAGKSRNGTYGDWVAEVDWSVGQILDALRRLRLDEKTLVIFTSDNGPWASKGDAGGVSGPLRGSKGCTLEGGVREPTIAWWPGTIEAGRQSKAIAGTTDVLPTLVSLAGGKLRDEVKIDGVDISQHLLGKAEGTGRDIWHYYQGNNLQAVRSGPWKLALTAQSIGMGMKEKPADLQGNAPRLYNLDDDIGETKNVAVSHPEIVARLKKLSDEMKMDIGSGKPGPGVRAAGVVENPVTLYPTVPRVKKSKIQSKSSAKPGERSVNWKTVKVGDAFSSSQVPDVAGRPFDVTCTISRSKADAVVIAHGGAAVGYSLYQQSGKLVFAVRHRSDAIYRTQVDLPVTTDYSVTATLKAAGDIQLTVNGTSSPVVRTGKPLDRVPQEDFCVGHDSRNPVDDSGPHGRFDGRVLQLKVTLTH